MGQDISESEQAGKQHTEVSHPESLSVWGLAWPSILNNLLFASVGLVAIKAVGNLGAGPVAAVGTGQRIFWVFQALLMAVMAGTTALVPSNQGLYWNMPSYFCRNCFLSLVISK